MVTEVSGLDRADVALREWAAWVAGAGCGDGFPSTNVLHQSWLPPAPGQTPTMRVGGRGSQREREVHAAIGRMSMRLANTLVVVYVLRAPADEQALRLDCAESTVRARVVEAKRRLMQELSWLHA